MDDRIIVRVGDDLLREIERRIDTGESEDKSKLVRKSLRYYFENHPTTQDRLDSLEKEVLVLREEMEVLKSEHTSSYKKITTEK